MSAILSGSSRTALSFIRQHWADLVQVSLLPVAAMLAAMMAQLLMYRRFFSDLLPMIENAQFDGSLFSEIMNMQAFGLIGTLAVAVIGSWYFVRLVRLYALGEKPWLGLDKKPMMASLMTTLYLLGIYVLSLLAYLAALLAMIIPLVIAGMAMIHGDDAPLGFVALVIFAVVAIVAFIIWFACRFLVGLPAVALGETPDFFKDMWTLSKGASWSLPWRVLVTSLIFCVFMLAVSLVYVGVFARELWNAFANIGAQTSPVHFFESLFDSLIAVQAMVLIVQQPFTWFLVILTAEAYRRFSEARGQARPAMRR